MRNRALLSFGNFFAVAHFYLIVYIIAPYLATFLPASSTGLVVSLGALITLIAFPLMPRLVRFIGPRRLAIILAAIEGLALLFLSFGQTFWPVVLVTAIALSLSPLIVYQLDLLLEATVENEGATGRIRTAFLTAGNTALVIAPLIVGALLDSTDAYDRVFFVAAASLLPFMFLLFFKKFPEGTPPSFADMRIALHCVFNDPDLRAVGIANATLQFLYHLAPLYIPLYLHTILGIPWSQLGWMFSIMLLPFVLLEYPAGLLADRQWGDKELMVAGFAIAGIAFASLAFVHDPTHIITIVIILVASRIGAALIEAMAEGHFFRRVSERDANTVGVFRMMRPVAALVAPIIGSIILIFGNYSILFIGTGIAIFLVGIASALAIRDIR